MSEFVATSLKELKSAGSILSRFSSRHVVANGLVAICLTLLLTVSDAFETQNLSLLHQLGLWAIVSGLLIVQLTLSQQIIHRHLNGSFIKTAIAIVIAVFITTLLMTLELHLMKFTPLLPKQPDPLPEFFLFVAQPVVAMAGLVLVMQYLSTPINRSKADSTMVLSRSGNSEYLNKQQELFEIIDGSTVLHIQAHDHYLELHCDEDNHFIRARMKDAIEKFSESDGIQVHRSHWISYRNIQRVFRDGRDYKVLLKNNSVIPVARSRVSALKRID